MSAAVVAGSGVAFGVIGLAKPHPWVVGAVLLAILLSNGFAGLAAHNARRWVKIHQARARYVLEHLSPELHQLQTSVNGVMGVRGQAINRNAKLRTDRLLIGLHIVLAGLAITLIALMPMWLS